MACVRTAASGPAAGDPESQHVVAVTGKVTVPGAGLAIAVESGPDIAPPAAASPRAVAARAAAGRVTAGGSGRSAGQRLLSAAATVFTHAYAAFLVSGCTPSGRSVDPSFCAAVYQSATRTFRNVLGSPAMSAFMRGIQF